MFRNVADEERELVRTLPVARRGADPVRGADFLLKPQILGDLDYCIEGHIELDPENETVG